MSFITERNPSHCSSPSVARIICSGYSRTMVLSRLSLGLLGRQNPNAILAKARGAYRFASAMVPRAAVAATIQWTCPETEKHHYLLIQRKNPPDAKKWCPPGGKIILGEGTLEAASRELYEETGLQDCRWHRHPFLTTDAIVKDNQASGSNNYMFHYVIAHCFAKAPACSSGKPPKVVPSDDALDAKWYTVEELSNVDCSSFTFDVLERAEAMSEAGVLSVETNGFIG